MSFARVVVYGAGAVGSYLGARLVSTLPVTLVARLEHVEAIKGRGLFVGGKADIFIAPDKIQAMPGVSSLQQASLVIVATKLNGMTEAGKVLESIAKPDSVFLLIQNGMEGNELFLKGAGRKLTVVRAVASCGVDFRDPGKIDFWGGGLSFEPGKGSAELVELFKRAGVEASESDDFQKALWLKLAANCVINPLTALLEVRNSDAMIPELADLRQRIVDEVSAVALAEGIELPDDLALTIGSNLESGGNRSSMLQDVLMGRETEVDHLNGFVVERARRHGTDATVNECLAALVRAKLAGAKGLL